MNIEDLTLKQINELKNLFSSNIQSEDICRKWIGKYVIIRTYSAGVHFGVLSKKIGNEVILNNARRIWYWENAFTLSKVSLDGVSVNSKLSAIIPEIKLTEVEIIPCSDKSIKILTEIKEYVP